MGDTVAASPQLMFDGYKHAGLNRIEAARLVRQHFNTLPVIILTISEEKGKIFDGLRTDATCYLQKKQLDFFF